MTLLQSMGVSRFVLCILCGVLGDHLASCGRLPGSWAAESKLKAVVDAAAESKHFASGSVVALPADGEAARLSFLPASEPLPEDGLVVARATYVDSSVTKSNFGKLRIEANDESFESLLRYRAAGFAEGYLSAGAIWDHFRNTRDYFKTSLYPGLDIWDAPMKWLHDQEAWVMQQLEARTKGRPGEASRSSSGSGGSSSSGSGGSSNSGSGGSSNSGSGSGRVGLDVDGGGGGGEVDEGLATDEEEVPHTRLWESVGLQVAQFNGLVEGYAARRLHELQLAPKGDTQRGGGRAVPGYMSRDDHLFLQNNGELYDIVDGYLAGGCGGGGSGRGADTRAAAGQGGSSSSRKEGEPLSPGRWLTDLALKGHCSALIKVAADLSDIYMGHATWDSYTQALRIFKHYDLGGPGHGRLSFSSYPGETFSDDDFYLSESGLVVMETTDHIFDPSIYSGLSTHTLLSWQRVRTALLLASSGEEWLRVFRYKNSGTYNNQYMVVDLKRFEPKQRLAPGLLWVVEQLPGIIEAGDMTDALSRGHWGSYNVPSFPKIYNASGYPQALAAISHDQSQAKDADTRARYEVAKRWLLYQAAPRANIYRRNQNAVDVRFAHSFDGLDADQPPLSGAASLGGSISHGRHESDLDGMKALMRFNNYREDKFSFGSPVEAVCSRGDLMPVDKAPWGGAGDKLTIAKGCYDGKVTNYRLASRLQSEVVNGPTRSHGLPPFSWKEWLRTSNMTIYGHPDTFDYNWERMEAEELPLPKMPKAGVML